MQPLVGSYESCWVLNQQNGSELDCMSVIDVRLRASNANKPLTKTDREYARKFVENIMFRQWHEKAVAASLPWNSKFPDAEGISEACTDAEESANLSMYAVIDCINAPTRKNLVAACRHARRRAGPGE